MSISTIKADLNQIAQIIREERKKLLNIEPTLINIRDKLNDIPSYFSGTISEINGLSASDANDVYKDEKDQMQAEYVALRNTAQSMINAIDSITI